MRYVAFLAISFSIPLIAGCGDTASNRVAGGRLAGDSAWHRCTRGDSVAAKWSCSPRALSSTAFHRLADASRSARQRLDSDSSADALHDAALLALQLRDSTRHGLDDAVLLLDRARRVAATNTLNVGILNDFAVMQIEVGQREQTIRPYLAALDAIERTLAADSMFVPALFNRALVLERLYMTATARRAWVRYLTAEHDAAWKREAQEHESRLARAPDAPAVAPGGRDQAFVLLGEWGRAVGRGDHASAATRLDSARRIAARLDSLHADQSVHLAVAIVDAEVRRRTPERLAAAHADLSDGVNALNHAGYEEAADHLGRAERELRAVGSAAAGWAAFYHASAEMNRLKYDSADHLLLQVLNDTLPQQPALVGKAVSTRGVIQARRGNFELAIGHYRKALPDLARAKEPYNEGGTIYLLSESLSSAGQYAAGIADAYHGLRLLAPYRKSNFLNNHLSTVAAYARAYRLPYAARAVMDEVLTVAPRLGNDDALSLAYRSRARDLIETGRRDSAQAELTVALQAANQLKGEVRDRRRADIQLVQGQLERADNPRAALTLLAGVAEAYGRLGADSKASAAMYEAAMAALGAGDTAQARDWLGKSIAQIERQQKTFETAEGRAALFETADNAFDAMIDLELRARRPDAAFNYLERERAAAKLASVQVSSNGAAGAIPSLESIRRHLPSDMLFVEYAVLGDRTIAWTASRRGTNRHVIEVRRDTVAALVERFLGEKAIAGHRDGDASGRLFDLLIANLGDDLKGVQQISVVPDRELSRLAFAALWDREAQQYVVERYQMRTEPSAAFFLAARAATPTSGRRTGSSAPAALVVGNPMLDTAWHLEALPGAAGEANLVATFYQNATVLTDSAARLDTIVTLLGVKTVFHFAGHAVFNGDRPELSYLALGRPRGDGWSDSSGVSSGGKSGALEAREIGKLRLSNLELVVLSACRTVSSRTSRTGGVAGLASSFLRAGAPAIVSTLWDVSDEATGPLLEAFHKRFAASGSAAAALREAQLEALRLRRAPAIWAAFIYTGP